MGTFPGVFYKKMCIRDSTQTTIDGGIVTAGTVQLAGSDASIKAGITGEGTADTSVRFWAGARCV